MKPLLFPLFALLMACGSADAEPAEQSEVAIAVTALAPVHRGANTFSLTTVADATNVEVTAWMPSMGHGAATDPRVVRDGATFRVEDVVFSMPGTWELKVNVTCPDRHGTRAFRFEVP